MLLKLWNYIIGDLNKVMTKILTTKINYPEKVIAGQNMKNGDTFNIVNVKYKSGLSEKRPKTKNSTKMPVSGWEIIKNESNQEPDGFISEDIKKGEELKKIYLFKG